MTNPKIKKPKILVGAIVFITAFGVLGGIAALTADSSYDSGYEVSDSDADYEIESTNLEAERLETEAAKLELETERLKLEQQQQMQAEAIAEQQELAREQEEKAYVERTSETFQRFGDVALDYFEFVSENDLDFESSGEAEQLSEYYVRELRSIGTEDIDPKLASAIQVVQSFSNDYHAIVIDYSKALASVDRDQGMDALQGCADAASGSETWLGGLVKCTAGSALYGTGSAAIEEINNGFEQYQIADRLDELGGSYVPVLDKFSDLGEHLEAEYGITYQN